RVGGVAVRHLEQRFRQVVHDRVELALGGRAGGGGEGFERVLELAESSRVEQLDRVPEVLVHAVFDASTHLWRDEDRWWASIAAAARSRATRGRLARPPPR